MSTPDSGRRVTLKDIAKQVGITHGAVSLALRGSPRIAEATRKRVQEIARQLSYQPNPMATGLSHFRRNSKEKPIQAALAWLNFWSEPKRLRMYKEFDSYWLGASACAEKSGYRLEEIVCRDISPDRLEKILHARGIEGVLLSPGLLDDEWQHLHWEQLAVVRLGQPHKNEFIHSVTSNQTANTILAFNKIREKGYRRIGFVGIRWMERLFCPGFLWAQELEIPDHSRIPPLLFQQTDNDENREKLAIWMKEYKPDAIITEIPALKDLLEQQGYQVPKDVALAATSVLDCAIDAGIDQKPAEVGRVAILLLLSLITDNERGIPPVRREIFITGNWVDGVSLPPRRN